MANKLKKKTTDNPKSKPKKSDTKGLKADNQEKIDLKSLARDERTWKIIGTISLFFSLILVVAFVSYFFVGSFLADSAFLVYCCTVARRRAPDDGLLPS